MLYCLVVKQLNLNQPKQKNGMKENKCTGNNMINILYEQIDFKRERIKLTMMTAKRMQYNLKS